MQRKILSLLLSAVVIFTAISGCSKDESKPSIYPMDTVVSLHTEKQSYYLNKSNPSKNLLSVTGKKELSVPKPVEFSWDIPAEGSPYTLLISESSDMNNADVYTVSEMQTEIYNLKLDTDYYWTVSNGSITSEIRHFQTESSAPRNIYVEGVTNVRDLGGWETENGGRTAQGLIYRCGRLNESSADKPTVEITESGIDTMRNSLGVKTEIDLRLIYDGEVGAITHSPLGEDVNYISCPMEWEGDKYNDNKEEILHFFEVLSEKDNYPIIFHCNIGTDRTGMLSFLINALLGVSEDDLIRDYLYSNFGKIGGTRKVSSLTDSTYYEAVMNAEGNTLSEKAYNCLTDIGVAPEQLDSIISIMTEK